MKTKFFEYEEYLTQDNKFIFKKISNYEYISYTESDDEELINKPITGEINNLLCLSFCLEGKSKTIIKNLKIYYQYTQNEAILFWNNYPIKITNIKQSKEFKGISIYYDLNKIKKYYKGNLFDKIGIKKIIIPHKINNIIQDIKNLDLNNLGEHEILLQSYTKYILFWIISSVNNGDFNENEERKIESIIEKIEKYPNINYNITVISKELNMSQKKISDIFYMNYNSKPKQYIIEIIMKKALILLETKSIEQTSKTLGYSNRHNFSRAFKKYYGYSPNKKIKNK